MFRDDAALAARAAAVSAKARDVTEVLAELGLPPVVPAAARLTVAYHSACSMQHGQKVEQPPRALLAAAGFAVKEIAEGHLCCGSAGTYNVLQPELAKRLRERKLAHIARTRADVVATGNVGCITQLAAGARRAGRAHGGAARLGDGRAAAARARELERRAPRRMPQARTEESDE